MDYPQIIVSKRGELYHACVGGNEAIWESGQTAESAIGKLVISQQERFCVRVELPSQPKRDSSVTVLAPQLWLSRAKAAFEEAERLNPGGGHL